MLRGLVALLTCVLGIRAELWVPAILQSHMVLPVNASLWGTASPGSLISLHLNHSSVPISQATAAANGSWRFSFHVPPTASPTALTISGDNGTKVMSGVLFGRLILCSGQSNMAITIDDFSSYTDLPGFNTTRTLAQSNLYSDVIRVMTVKPAGHPNPGPASVDVTSAAAYFWAPANSTTLSGGSGYFSAECWGVGKALSDAQPGMPIGLISSAYSGSMIQSWMSTRAIKACPDAKLLHPPRFGGQGQWWNGMIAPILPLVPTAVVWHQGEENADDAVDYKCFFQAMIKDWREAAQAPQMPFVFVQLQPCGIPPDQRYAQAAALTLPYTGMASCVDLGDCLTNQYTTSKPL